MLDPKRPDGTIYSSRPLYSRPVADWRKFMLDANSRHVKEFALFAARKYGDGRKGLLATEIYREFCLSASADCGSELQRRLGARDAMERIASYRSEMEQLIARHPGLELLKMGGEAERIRATDVRQKDGDYTHRLYLNPKLGAMAEVMELLLENQGFATGARMDVGNVFQFKAIAPDAMIANGNADCINFVRPDRIIVNFHEDDLRQINVIMRMLNVEIGANRLLEQRPAFSIPYVYEYNGETRVVSFGLYGRDVRYGKLIAESLASAYAGLAKKGKFSVEEARDELAKSFPKRMGEPILELVHRLYDANGLAFALNHLKNEKQASE